MKHYAGLTPAKIKECYENDDGTPTDIFELAVPETNQYRAGLVKAMWARFRYWMIGSKDVDLFIQELSDRAFLIDRKYQYLIGVYSGNAIEDPFKGRTESSTKNKVTTPTGEDKSKTTMGGSTSSTVTVTKQDKESGTDTKTLTGTVVTSQDGTDKVTETNEDMPATSGASSSSYLSDRKITQSEPGVSVTETPDTVETRTPDITKDSTETTTSESNPGTTSETVRTPGIVETEATDNDLTVKYWDDTMMELLAKMKDAYFDPFFEYTNEFEDMFVNRWNTCNCGCDE